MDLLTDILSQAGLRRRFLGMTDVKDGEALLFSCNRSIGLHAVVQGHVFIHGGALPAPLELRVGDIAVTTRGFRHHVATDSTIEYATERVMLEGVSASQPSAMNDAQGRVVSAAYQFWNEPLHPFFTELPPCFLLGNDAASRLCPLSLTVGLLDAESRQGELGSTSVLHGLLDVVLAYALREIVDRHASDKPGWNLAVRDTQIRHVLTLMHEQTNHPWTLESLASQAGLSRTYLANRFRSALGDSPLNYLRTIRMQKAVQLLIETEQSIEQVAQSVGYGDAFGFSKVFKRVVGSSPREFRRRDTEERLDCFRLP